MSLDIPATLASLGPIRPVFHSEADFQHSLAWQIHLADPDAQIRLETRSARHIRLDLLVSSAEQRTAIELKYLVASFRGDIGGEYYQLPDQSAQDISRHDFIKDILRIEGLVTAGIVDIGWAVALTNDPSYWQPGRKTDPIDAEFRSTRDMCLRVASGGRRQRAQGQPGTGRNDSFSTAATSATGTTTRPSRMSTVASTAGATSRFGYQKGDPLTLPRRPCIRLVLDTRILAM